MEVAPLLHADAPKEPPPHAVQPEAPPASCCSRLQYCCCNSLKCVALAGSVVVVFFGIGFGSTKGIPYIFDKTAECKDGYCRDRCGLPAKSDSSPRVYGFLYRDVHDWPAGKVMLGANIFSAVNVLLWNQYLPGCVSVVFGDVVNSTAATACSNSCRAAEIALAPECFLEMIVSDPVRACYKSYFGELCQRIPYPMIVGGAGLYMIISVTIARLTMCRKGTNVKQQPEKNWQNQIVKASFPYNIYAGRMKAGDLARLDLTVRGLSMCSDRYSDVVSMMVYARAGQPVFASLAALSLLAGGDPLQIHGMQGFFESWEQGRPTDELLENSVHEGYFEGTLGAVLPLASMCSSLTSSPDALTAASLGVSGALSLNSVFSAVQAAELLGAKKILDEKKKKDFTYIDLLALQKTLAGRGLGALRVFSGAMVVATAPFWSSFAFGMCVVLLIINNLLASGCARSCASLFPMAIHPDPVMTLSTDEPAQHGPALFIFRILLIFFAFLMKAFVGLGEQRAGGLAAAILLVEILAGVVALLLLFLSWIGESSCCESRLTSIVWSKKSAMLLTQELKKGWDADAVMKMHDDEYVPLPRAVCDPEAGTTRKLALSGASSSTPQE